MDAPQAGPYAFFGISLWLCASFLTFWCNKMFQAHIILSLKLTLPESTISPRSRNVFLVEKVFRNQDLNGRCAHCYWDALASRSSQKTTLGHMCMLISISMTMLSS